MSADLQALKAAVPFLELVGETHDVDRSGKVLCPAHSDTRPSCHVYDNGAYCYACGWRADHIDWLEAILNLSTAEAIKELERRTGGYIPSVAERRATSPVRTMTFKPVAETALTQHRRRAAQLDRIPAATQGRSFTLDDHRRLQVARYGDDAVFPVPNPNGVVLALKRRYAEPRNGVRYRYTTKGCGTPAWCSPTFRNAETVLVVEGELNGAACYLAHPELAVLGVAGASGSLHLEVLKGKRVYVYGDGDEPGQRARDRWAAQALSVGARVYVLEPWPADACDLAGSEGRAALADLLARSLEAARVFDAAAPFNAPSSASNYSRVSPGTPHLMSSRTHSEDFGAKPRLGGKPCL